MPRQPKQIIYRDNKYGFTLRFPGWWRAYTVISRKKADRDTEYEVHFKFKYKGKVYGDIFALLVYRMTRKEWLEAGYGDSPLVYIAEYNGRVFAYLTPGELPYEFIDPQTGDYDYKKYGAAIAILKRMVNRDVPRIVETLRFPREGSVIRSLPLRSRKVWPRRCRRK